MFCGGFGIVQDMNSVLATTARREYIPVGSASASMLTTAVAASSEFMPSGFVCPFEP
jgi:hypothetical protein